MPLRQPETRVTVGGVVIAGVVAVEVASGGAFLASRFQVTVAAAAVGFDYLLGLGGQIVTVEAAAGGYMPLLTGQVDGVKIDVAGGVAVLFGRDLAARLIDAELEESFVNQTASQVAVTLAGRHQLDANVTQTTGLVGQYNQIDHVRTALLANSKWATEWSLLTGLAMAEGFSLSVTGTMLNFGPVAAPATRVVAPGDFTALSFDVISALPGAVSVKSWSPRNKAATSAAVGAGRGTQIVRANLTDAQAAAMAANHLGVLGLHGRSLSGCMEGDGTLMPGDRLVLGGTGSGLDATYAVTAIVRKISAKSGFVQVVRAGLA